MTADEKRLKVRNKYKTIIGRNSYSQAKRNYCYKKYSDGKYYSDCSSSICYTYKEVGYGFGIMNTTGMYSSSKLVDVPVKIKNGLIQNPEVLKIGDMLLFAGNDTSRKAYGYVGHVEMVGEISGSKIMLYGHGSGNPKRHEMNAYCKSRYNTKSSTPLGRRLLIKVRRFIRDDDGDKTIVDTNSYINVIHGNYYVRSEPDKASSSIAVVHDGDKIAWSGNTKNGWFEVTVNGKTGWLSTKAGIAVKGSVYLTVKVGNWYVRKGASGTSAKLAIANSGNQLEYLNEESNGWLKVKYENQEGWISEKAITK